MGKKFGEYDSVSIPVRASHTSMATAQRLSAELDEKRETPTMTIEATKKGLTDLICSFETNGLYRRTLNVAHEYLKNYQRDIAVMQKMAEWIEQQLSISPCDVCTHQSMIEFFPDDVPEDVEPCKLKREKGCSACVDGIIEYFKTQK